MGRPVRSKKMTGWRSGPQTLDISRRRWSASAMKDVIFPLTRRHLLAGLGTGIFGPVSSAAAQGRAALMLQAKPSVAALRPGQPETPVWSLLTPQPGDMRFK